MSLFDLSGKVALITGSTKGIGLSIAEEMAKAGAKVVISSRTREACEAVANDIRQAGGEAVAIDCNIDYKDQLQALVDLSIAHFRKIDILV